MNGNELKAKRLAMGVTQKELAKMMKVAPSTISIIEKLNKSVPFDLESIFRAVQPDVLKREEAVCKRLEQLKSEVTDNNARLLLVIFRLLKHKQDYGYIFYDLNSLEVLQEFGINLNWLISGVGERSYDEIKLERVD